MFCEKSYIAFPSKIDKDNFEKNHNTKKPYRENTIEIYSIL